jgi:hypothetical protein
MPGQDLLEDFLDGIRSRWRLYHEYAEVSDGPELGSEADDKEYERRDVELNEAFTAAVRDEATTHRERLL